MPDRDINAIFVENLKSLLDSKKMTYADFANKIGVGASTVSMWMTGKSLPRMELLDKIADLFNVEVADLYFDRSKQDEHIKNVRKAMGLPTTIAAHFDGDEYTEEELEEIRQFAEFVKSKRKDNK